MSLFYFRDDKAIFASWKLKILFYALSMLLEGSKGGRVCQGTRQAPQKASRARTGLHRDLS